MIVSAARAWLKVLTDCFCHDFRMRRIEIMVVGCRITDHGSAAIRAVEVSSKVHGSPPGRTTAGRPRRGSSAAFVGYAARRFEQSGTIREANAEFVSKARAPFGRRPWEVWVYPYPGRTGSRSGELDCVARGREFGRATQSGAEWNRKDRRSFRGPAAATGPALIFRNAFAESRDVLSVASCITNRRSAASRAIDG